MAQQGDTAKARAAGTRALQLADGDPVLHGFATIGVAVARLLDGDVTARADLLAARDAGLRQHHDDLATTPMSNLCHLDVEQGRFDDAEESIASALRISEERDTPICTMWQLGVRARLRLLQDDWPAAERDARAVLAAGKFPLGKAVAAAGAGRARRAAGRAPGQPRPRRAVVPRRPDRQPRQDRACRGGARRAGVDPAATRPAAHRRAGRRPAFAYGRGRARRAAGVGLAGWPGRACRTSARWSTGRWAPPRGPYEQVLAHWDDDSAEALLAALPVLDDLGARAVGACSAAGSASWA